ncbi:MAG: class I SAM-dependent methyltransferase [Ruminococcus flavefaciens]|nr:class I SAM-dependent methyltransferase [Ruminococcus flavefaciens]
MNSQAYKTIKLFEDSYSVSDINIDGCSEVYSEMTDFDRKFLCGIIRDNTPRKIVEVGVAAGGTTVAILECIHELELECEVYSVDLLKQYHRDFGKTDARQTGFLVKEMKIYDKICDKHQLLLGEVLPARLDEIGGNIDLLILDTMHFVPGEILDFIAAFPYLASNAIVVLHDVVLQYRQNPPYLPTFSTAVLFQSVTADKFLNNQDVYPNIAAFQLNKDTSKYIQDVFAALVIPWHYMPKKKQLEQYGIIIRRYYAQGCVKIYEQAIYEAERYLLLEGRKDYTLIKVLLKNLDRSIFRYVLLYGAGKRGRTFLNLAKNWKMDINGFVVSDDQSIIEYVEDIPVYAYSKIPFDKSETLILQTAETYEIECVLQQSEYSWLQFPNDFWQFVIDYLEE